MSAKEWINERFPIKGKSLTETLLKEEIPIHMKKWLFAMGTTPFILFPLQIITGMLLAFYFIPSTEMAFESVRYITEEVRMGFWIRGIHHWGANLMVISIFLHMMRVFFTHSYRKPRELNWVVGFVLLFLTLTISFTGYSLTYNQVSFWAATVGTNLVKEVPFIGTALLEMMRGGGDVTINTLTRFYTLHVWLLPIIITLIVVFHIVMIRLHGISEPKEFEKGHYEFYPNHLYKIIIVTLFLISFLSLMAVLLPPGLGEPADPANTPLHIKPEWYFFPVFLFLRLVPLSVGLSLTGLAVLLMTFWPFFETLFSKNEKTRNVISRIVGSIAIIILIVFTIIESFSLI
ncbi:MAG: cytochrome bc complex cytochrome b subunit [Candidatus Marinimicrobia bacterium]|nr:cytochrome bc complex cytochrome b subunit [Candidatus Neomarinimicrobiota bacterium]MBL7109597.1 cytochrome bc complex cytochrome b subunit [Candidatus Neomarinimicrobiota bacterium]